MASIGTSGWGYNHWTPELYPPGLPQGQRLARYAAEFPTVELNASFYRWPRPATFRGWRERLPGGFRMSVKAPRGLTHARKLREPEGWVERIAAGWHELGDKRAVLLVQLGPAHARDNAVLGRFLAAMPAGIPVAMEFRHPTWHVEDVFAILEHHGAAYCVMSGAQLPCVLRLTAPFAYVRLHGPGQSSVRRVLQRHRPNLVGGPDPGVGRPGRRHPRVLQQRRRCRRRPKCTHPTRHAGHLTAAGGETGYPGRSRRLAGLPGQRRCHGGNQPGKDRPPGA